MVGNLSEEKEHVRTLEELCDETLFCSKTPESHLYDYCKLHPNRKVECNHRALSPDYTGYHPCFKYFDNTYFN